MDTYVVIHVKKRDEKVKIMTFLAAETDSEFKVTMDLKEFVAEKYNVKITDYVEMKDQATDMGQENAINIITVKNEEVNNIVDVVPIVDIPTIVNNMDTVHRQNTDMAGIQPSEDVNTESHLQMDNQQELLNIGTYVPYRDRMIQPKQEVVDEMVGDDRWLMEMEREQEMMEEQEGGDVGLLMAMDGDGLVNDDIDNESGDNTTIDKDIPSTSTKRRRPDKKKVDAPSSSRRLGRTTKRPRYSMDDENEEEKAETALKAQGTKKKNNCCQKCGSEVQGIFPKVEHVLMHAKMTKYECTVDECGYKTAYKCAIKTHMKKHVKQSDNYREVQFTREQTEEFEKMKNECFPVTNENKENICQVCQQSIGGNSNNLSKSKKEHALHHIGIMLYKCMGEGCQFESKTDRLMRSHNSTHGLNSKQNFTKIELTKEQEEEIEKMFVKCFPMLG